MRVYVTPLTPKLMHMLHNSAHAAQNIGFTAAAADQQPWLHLYVCVEQREAHAVGRHKHMFASRILVATGLESGVCGCLDTCQGWAHRK